MKHCGQLLALLMGVALGLAACSNKPVEATDLKTLFPSPDPVSRELLDQASAALKTNDYAGAIMALQAIRSQPNLTPEQGDAIQEIIVKVQQPLLEKVDKGDPAAVKALEEIRRSGRR